jgi:hypothetical protein
MKNGCNSPSFPISQRMRRLQSALESRGRGFQTIPPAVKRMASTKGNLSALATIRRVSFMAGYIRYGSVLEALTQALVGLSRMYRIFLMVVDAPFWKEDIFMVMGMPLNRAYTSPPYFFLLFVCRHFIRVLHAFLCRQLPSRPMHRRPQARGQHGRDFQQNGTIAPSVCSELGLTSWVHRSLRISKESGLNSPFK